MTTLHDRNTVFLTTRRYQSPPELEMSSLTEH
jgi:hypothetical protein